MGEQYVGGDFNSIKRPSQRKGSKAQSNSVEMINFCEFITKLDLIDLPALGNKLTWFEIVGTSMSRLNRFLFQKVYLTSGN